MTRCNQEEIRPQYQRLHSGNAVTKEQNYDASHQSGEDQGMGESTVSPKVRVADSESKTEDIEVGYETTTMPLQVLQLNRAQITTRAQLRQVLVATFPVRRLPRS